MDKALKSRMNDELAAALFVVVSRLCDENHELTDSETQALPSLVHELREQIGCLEADCYKPVYALGSLLTCEEYTQPQKEGDSQHG